MDSLYHLVFALAGGFVLVKGLSVRYNFSVLAGLAFLSVLIDVDHLWMSQVFHNIFVLFVPALLLFFGFLFRWRRVRLYSLVLFVMFFGHLLADMTFGMGIPLLYPFDASLHRFSSFVMSPNLVSGFGLTLLAYFGLICLLVFLHRLRSFV